MNSAITNENGRDNSKSRIKYVELSDIREESPFKDLFEIKPDDLEAIQNHMSEHGYDGSQPLVLWKEKGIVIDGHTRLKAVKNLQANIKLWRSRMKEFDSIPIIELPFETEEEALDYAIHNQTERRNLTEGEILKLVEKVDQRSSNWGGIRKGDGLKSSFGNPKVDSRERTAQIVGISKDKVSQCRHILEHCNDPTIEAVYRGEKTLNQVYYESIEGVRREKRKCTKHEDLRKILGKLKTPSFGTDSTKEGLKEFGARVEHVDKLCGELLPEILKKGPVMEEIKEKVLFFSNQGKEIIEALSGQTPIQEFLASGFVDDFLSVLTLFGFEVKKPANLLPTERMEEKTKPKHRGNGSPRFDIDKVHEVDFVSKAEIAGQTKYLSQLAERDIEANRGSR